MSALARRAVLVALLAGVASVVQATVARADTYDVRVCGDASGAGFQGPAYANHAFAAVSSSADPIGTMGGGDSCASGGNASGTLSMSGHSTTPTGTYAGYQASAPAPLRIRAFSLDRAMYAFGPPARAWSVQAQALVDGSWRMLEYCWNTESPCTAGGRVAFPLASGTTAVRDLVWCQNGLADGQCYGDQRSNEAWLFIRAATLTVDDPTDPALDVDGTGLGRDGATIAGQAAATFAAADPDSGVRRVELLVDGRAVNAVEFPGDQTSFRPYAASRSGRFSFDTTEVANGRHEVTVRAFNASGGGSTLRTATVTVDNPVAPAAKSRADASASHASLLAEFADHSRTRIVRYGTPVPISGRVTDPSGAPIAGARLAVSELGREPGAVAHDAGAVTAERDGSWRYVAAVGSSREITFAFRSGDGDVALTDRTSVTLLVRAAARLSVSRRRVRNGQAVMVSGRLRGRPYPSPGVLVTLQGKPRRGGSWRTFGVSRTRPDGRFAHGYRFSRVRGRARFVFRARIASQPSYPYESGTTRRAAVTVTR
jgi:hypothetical protein